MSLDSRPSSAPETKRFGSSLTRPEPPGQSAPTVIAGKYRLERLLGEGGGGSVWHATNLQLELPVAIKLLRAGPTQRELGERLRIEARAAARLVHPGIVRVFDIGEADGGEPFIVMELLSGESLSDRIYRERLSAIDAVRLMLPIAEALAVAHAAGVVHRDLKPDNVILCPEGDCIRPKLLDFGIAKVTGGAKRSNITQRGTLVGSPSYMSPEQARGSDNLDFRTDIWSFCVVLYEALAGAMPFEAPDGGALLRAVIQDPPRPLARERGVDRQLWSLIEQGLSKQASLRPSSMTELGRELARWLRRHGVDTDAAGTPIDSRWLPRTSLALATHGRAPLPVSSPSLAPRLLLGDGRVAGHARRQPAPRQPTTLDAVTHRGPDRAPRGTKKAKPPEDRFLVLGATAATLLTLFLGVLWAVGAFEDDPPPRATARFEAPAQAEPATAGMVALGSPGMPPSAPAEAPPKASSAPTQDPPAAAPQPAANAETPQPSAPPVPAAPPAATAVATQPASPTPVTTYRTAATAKASAPSLTSTLRSLSPPPPKRTGGAPKPRAEGPAPDLMVPY